MLSELQIRDFAVIESLDIEFAAGMTVFTGETGAGKSIIVDAMGLILGDRSDSSVIRAGQAKTEICARFTVAPESDIHALLDEQAIDLDDELFIRRVINQDGRSKAFVNGSPTPIQLLKALGEHLVDIHGQHAHQSLLRKDAQRQMLDEYAGHANLLTEVNNHYHSWHSIQSQLQQLSGDNDNREAQLKLLKYQVEELQALELKTDEYSELNQQAKRLNNAQRLLEDVQSALNDLCESDHSLLAIVHKHQQNLTGLADSDERLKAITDLLATASIQLQEASHEARTYLDQVEVNPEKLAEVEDRIGHLHETARKHQIHPRELAAHYQMLDQQLQSLLGGEARYQQLTELSEQTLKDYRAAAEQLHQSRHKAAENLNQAVVDKLQQLGMAGAGFAIVLEHQQDAAPKKDGLDSVELRVSANPGQPLKPLAKVASGGELSRISLAIQVVNREHSRIPSFVFDEVDAGIGGTTADVVGKLLYSLTDSNQVFCVTHLPQVACYADRHFHLKKTSLGNSTQTAVSQLDQQARVREIARMLGSAEATETSLAHALEMLNAKQRDTAA